MLQRLVLAVCGAIMLRLIVPLQAAATPIGSTIVDFCRDFNETVPAGALPLSFESVSASEEKLSAGVGQVVDFAKYYHYTTIRNSSALSENERLLLHFKLVFSKFLLARAEAKLKIYSEQPAQLSYLQRDLDLLEDLTDSQVLGEEAAENEWNAKAKTIQCTLFFIAIELAAMEAESTQLLSSIETLIADESLSLVETTKEIAKLVVRNEKKMQAWAKQLKQDATKINEVVKMNRLIVTAKRELVTAINDPRILGMVSPTPHLSGTVVSHILMIHFMLAIAEEEMRLKALRDHKYNLEQFEKGRRTITGLSMQIAATRSLHFHQDYFFPSITGYFAKWSELVLLAISSLSLSQEERIKLTIWHSDLSHAITAISNECPIEMQGQVVTQVISNFQNNNIASIFGVMGSREYTPPVYFDDPLDPKVQRDLINFYKNELKQMKGTIEEFLSNHIGNITDLAKQTGLTTDLLERIFSMFARLKWIILKDSIEQYPTRKSFQALEEINLYYIRAQFWWIELADTLNLYGIERSYKPDFLRECLVFFVKVHDFLNLRNLEPKIQDAIAVLSGRGDLLPNKPKRRAAYIQKYKTSVGNILQLLENTSLFKDIGKIGGSSRTISQDATLRLLSMHEQLSEIENQKNLALKLKTLNLQQSYFGLETKAFYDLSSIFFSTVLHDYKSDIVRFKRNMAGMQSDRVEFIQEEINRLSDPNSLSQGDVKMNEFFQFPSVSNLNVLFHWLAISCSDSINTFQLHGSHTKDNSQWQAIREYLAALNPLFSEFQIMFNDEDEIFLRSARINELIKDVVDEYRRVDEKLSSLFNFN